MQISSELTALKTVLRETFPLFRLLKFAAALVLLTMIDPVLYLLKQQYTSRRYPPFQKIVGASALTRMTNALVSYYQTRLLWLSVHCNAAFIRLLYQPI